MSYQRQLGFSHLKLLAFLLLANAFQTPALSQPRENGNARPNAATAARALEFSDVAANHAARPAIIRMVSQGILRPLSPAKFGPDEPLTRGEFVVAVQRMFGLRAKKTVDFSDVPPDNPIYGALQAVEPYLGRQLLCFGCALGSTFAPNEAISSAEAVLSLTLVLVSKGKLKPASADETGRVLAGVADAKEFSPPSRVFFATALKEGISYPETAKGIELGSPLKRASAAQILDRVQEKFNLPKLSPSR